jgi:hypothetical protein
MGENEWKRTVRSINKSHKKLNLVVDLLSLFIDGYLHASAHFLLSIPFFIEYFDI